MEGDSASESDLWFEWIVIFCGIKDMGSLEHSSPGRYSACVTATVRVTLRDGTFHEDIGGGPSEGMRSKADSLLKAPREATTDTTRRALEISIHDSAFHFTTVRMYPKWLAD